MGPSPENVSTMKVGLQYFFLSLCENDTQYHLRRMKYNVSSLLLGFLVSDYGVYQLSLLLSLACFSLFHKIHLYRE